MSKGTTSKDLETVNIQPGSSILSVLRHLNYKPWFALAEFVDNSIQSYTRNRDSLRKISGPDTFLKVNITIDPDAKRITISDNACGIAQADFRRAFKPAAVPPDTSGLSEFGMGMKSAACWFSPNWEIRTTALNESVERRVKVDVNQIVTDDVEELTISQSTSDLNSHYTEVILENLHHVPVRRSIGKIKDHLTDIYRVFMREGELQLYFNGDLLRYKEPKVLTAPYFKDKKGAEKTWKREIDFDLGHGQSVKGFAALRDPGKYSKSGFSLFRRNRLIQGSDDEGYRPLSIFRFQSSYRSLRLFGELHLEGFEVSHTKDGFRWDESEQRFLDALETHLDSKELPLLQQADGYRAQLPKNELAEMSRNAVDKTARVIEEELPRSLPSVADEPPEDTQTDALSEQPYIHDREIIIDFRDQQWLIKIELTDDPVEIEWLKISDLEGTDDVDTVIEIRVAVDHPFMKRFGQKNSDEMQALLRVAAGLALAEKLARLAGHKYTGTIRRNFNQLLYNSLHQP